MARKRGLGSSVENSEIEKDLLGGLFGTNEQKIDRKKVERVNKCLRLDKTLSKQVKQYALDNELKEYEVIELALHRLFEKSE